MLPTTSLWSQSLSEKANSGDMNAQYRYAQALFKKSESDTTFLGNIMRKDALKWYLKAAKQGHANAQNKLGVCYFEGKGVKQDYLQAFFWYNKSAAQNNVYALYNIGYCYENGKGVSKSLSNAFECYQKSADLGHTGAQYALALMYLQGTVVERDSIVAAQWLLSSAGGGFITPHNNLESDEKKANEKARNKLVSLSQVYNSSYYSFFMAILGCLYESEGNYAKAENAYKKAIDAKSILGTVKLGLMYFYVNANNMTLSSYMENYTESDGFGLEGWKYNKRQQAGLKEYLKTKTWNDTDNCIYWLEKAINCNVGQFTFGTMDYTVYDYLLFCYNDGIGNFKNIEKALDISYKYLTDKNLGERKHFYFPEVVLRIAAENPIFAQKTFNLYQKIYECLKTPSSSYSSEIIKIATAGLGKAYYKGFGVVKDYSDAFKYLSIAADLNDSESMRLLAACYRYGRGVQENSIKEKYWLEKAMKHSDDKAIDLYKRLSKASCK